MLPGIEDPLKEEPDVGRRVCCGPVFWLFW